MTLQGGSLLVLYPRTDHGVCVAFYGHAVGAAVLKTAVRETRYVTVLGTIHDARRFIHRGAGRQCELLCSSFDNLERQADCKTETV